MQLALAAALWFRDKDRHPNFEALQLSPTMGWLLLLTIASLALFFVAHGDRWRRLWLSLGDPRSLGLFRIVFGVMTLCNINGLYEHWEYLFTEDGLFPTDVAQQVRARAQFAGYGDGSTPGEAVGFFSLAAFWEWLKGPTYSLLLFDSSRAMFWIHIVAFQLFMAAFIVGWQTRFTKWVAWFLFHSIILRNTIFWEGTENVYRCFFFYLCLSRCGAAYSVDNWRRCRRLRRAGQLSEVGGPGDGAGTVDAQGRVALHPIYAAVPMWPRYLMMVQTAIIYGYAGPTKNGSVWQAGDSFYYSFNLDHFYRFPPQELSAIFGTNLFRLNTYVVHFWQMFFPLVLVGLVLRWVKREGLPPLGGWRLGLSRAGLLGAGVGFLAMTLTAYPVHYVPYKDGPSLETVRAMVGVLAPLGALALGLFARKLWHKPPTLHLLGRAWTLDMQWFCSWFLGRRLWVGLGFIFHLHLVMMMNIGWFNPGMIASYIAFLNGSELGGIACEFRRALARLRGRPDEEVQGMQAIPAQLPAIGQKSDAHQRLPVALCFSALGMALVSAVRHAQTLADMWKPFSTVAHERKIDLPKALISQVPQVHAGWFFVCIAAMLLTVTLRRRSLRLFDSRFAPLLVAAPWAWSYLVEAGWVHMRWSVVAVVALSLFATRNKHSADEEAKLAASAPLAWTPTQGFAYASLGRLVAGSLVVYHLLALSSWILPEKDSLGTFRNEARAPFKWWIQSTHTTQSWAMFAPNPPRANTFLRVVVHDEGEKWDLNTDVYACFDEGSTPEICADVYPIPWLTYSRQRKMNRRIAGGEGGRGEWFQKWYARFICRDWARTHGGESPDKVELIKVSYPIPSPDAVAKNGAYDPKTHYLRKRKHEPVYTARCETSPFGRLNNEQRERLGFEPIDERLVKGWTKDRCKKWNEKMRRKAIERGDDPKSAQVDCLDKAVNKAAIAEQKAFDKELKRAKRAEDKAKKQAAKKQAAKKQAAKKQAAQSPAPKTRNKRVGEPKQAPTP